MTEGGSTLFDDRPFASVFLDQASDDNVCRKRAVHAGFTGSCVLGTGLGRISVPVVVDRALNRVVLLVKIAVAASVLWRTHPC